jgi:hypothetical protein
MTEERQPYLECGQGHEIRLPIAVPAGRPTPWPKGDPVPVQNFCCRECGESRQYSKAEVHFRDVTPAERQSLRTLKVVRQSTQCGHTGFLDKDCEGSIEILYVAGLEEVRPSLFPVIINFDDLYCTGYDKHKNSTDQTTAGANHVLGLWKESPVVDEIWEQIQSLCAAQEW